MRENKFNQFYLSKVLAFGISIFLSQSIVFAQQCASQEWLKGVQGEQKEKLLLLQTQMTALKLASLIDIYQNPQSNAEKEKAIDLLTKINNPLSDNHPLISNFERSAYTQKLLGLVEEAQRSMSSGSLTISYENMPALLMAYEMSSGRGIFNKKDYAVASFWEENNPNDNLMNPIMENLSNIYHGMTRKEREGLYSEIAPQLQERWNDLQNHAEMAGCEFQQDQILSKCGDYAAQVLRDIAVPFEKLSFQVTQILGHELTSQLQSLSLDNIDWQLHPPPQEPLPSYLVLTKSFGGTPYTEYRDQRRWYQDISKKDNLGFLQTFKQLEAAGPYLVLDKSKQRLFLYESEGTLKGSVEVGLEITFDRRADGAMGANSGAGAGIYELTDAKGELLTLKDQRNRQQLLTTEPGGIDCSNDGCSQMVAGLDALLSRNNLRLPLPFYILPLNESFEFVIKNDELAFTTFVKMDGYYQYNLTPRNGEAYPTKFEITDPNFQTPFAKEFLAALEKEKPKLMEIYGLDNDEFNELALLAFGILGQESQFGDHWRYKVKETFPGGVAYLKNYKRIFGEFKEDRKEEGFWSAVGDLLSDSWSNEIDFITGDLSLDQNSRGPTQIKKVPELISKNYGITKEQLKEPENAAIATVGFLAQSLEELKAKEKFHPAINGKNRFDYLHYIYMGKSREIINGTATPERNIYYQNVRRFSRSLKVWQDLTNS